MRGSAVLTAVESSDAARRMRARLAMTPRTALGER
jgi:hypothetical protein